MDNGICCGIDVSARELVVSWEAGKLRRFANSSAGHRDLVQTLRRTGSRVRVCLEATGLYGLDVALRLSAAQGLQVMVANPRAVRHFAQAMMQRSKNDALDAEVLREFAQRMPFVAWSRPSARMLAVWAIARRLEALTDLCTAEKNRGHAAGLSRRVPAAVRRDIAASLRFHRRSLQRLRTQALQQIQADPVLAQRFELLRSIRGIGETSAVQLLAELMLLPADRDVRQWVAYAGLDPREYSSGASVRQHPRISKLGNSHLRRALYMPALVASRFEPHLRGFYEHLLARGKSKPQAILAVARKLLHAIYGMFRSQKCFDGTRVFSLPAAPSVAELCP